MAYNGKINYYTYYIIRYLYKYGSIKNDYNISYLLLTKMPTILVSLYQPHNCTIIAALFYEI